MPNNKFKTCGHFIQISFSGFYCKTVNEWILVETLMPKQTGEHFADDSFSRIFLTEIVCISIKNIIEICASTIWLSKEQATNHCLNHWWPSSLTHIDGLVQERRNSSTLAMVLRLSCTNPSICVIWYGLVRYHCSYIIHTHTHTHTHTYIYIHIYIYILWLSMN